MAGAHVFPGGRLDKNDSSASACALLSAGAAALHERLGEALPAMQAAGLYVAAIRETFEEAGLLLGRLAAGWASGDARAAVASGAQFATLVEAIDAAALVPWVRWVTPEISPRRFDARFFLARAPAGQEPRVDGREATEGLWISPRAALGRWLDGDMLLAPATAKCLERCSPTRRSGRALAAAASRPPPVMMPHGLEQQGGRPGLHLAAGRPAPPARGRAGRHDLPPAARGRPLPAASKRTDRIGFPCVTTAPCPRSASARNPRHRERLRRARRSERARRARARTSSPSASASRTSRRRVQHAGGGDPRDPRGQARLHALGRHRRAARGGGAATWPACAAACRSAPEDVVVGAGAKPFIAYAILSTTDYGAGDEVIYPNPGFPIYESQIMAMRRGAGADPPARGARFRLRPGGARDD